MTQQLEAEFLLSLGTVDPEFQAFFEAANPPKVSYDSLDDFKRLIDERDRTAIERLGPPPPEIKQTTVTYPTQDGSRIRARLYQPTTPRGSEGSPLIVLFHGGGFCIGSLEGEEQTCRNLVQAFGAVCVSADYRLAPAYKFPQAPNDAWDALVWAAANAVSWGADTRKGFIVGGTSAGGNLAAVVTLLARDRKLSPPLTGTYLAIPLITSGPGTSGIEGTQGSDNAESNSKIPQSYLPYMLSYAQNRNAPVLPEAALDMFMRGYQPDETDGVLFAPINHPGGHKDLPPVFFQVNGYDPLRDEAIIYEHMLRQDYGIRTKMVLYPGVPHGHWGFFPALKSAEKFRRDQVEGMGWLLDRVPDFSNVVTRAAGAQV